MMQTSMLQIKYDALESDLKHEWENAMRECKDTYLVCLKDESVMLQNCVLQTEEEIAGYKQKLAEYRSKANAAVEAYKRAQEEKEKQDFYRIQLSQTDIEEIQKIKSVAPYLRDPRPLNKVLYSVYYQKPLSDLIGRVLGAERRTGIYKITNITNGKCYVGQAANGAVRWQLHVKCGIGAEKAPMNKLYPAMEKDGIENFTFEWLEDCDLEQLNEREQYWQDFYQAKVFGYSMK